MGDAHDLEESATSSFRTNAERQEPLYSPSLRDGPDPYVLHLLAEQAATAARHNTGSDSYLYAGICAHIIAAVPRDAPLVVRLACAAEAFERHDYNALEAPLARNLNIFRDALNADVSDLCNPSLLTRDQRKRYDELRVHPQILHSLMHGLSPRLALADKRAFVDQLRAAGRRHARRGDEEDAMNEGHVLHVALSYRHVNTHDGGGTIDQGTAEEAYAIICKMEGVKPDTVVRVWIDQNLHRYSTDAQWYEKGFFPYIVLPVVSALSAHRGFTVGRTRPWIWVETGAALLGRGIRCTPEISSTLSELIALPDSFEGNLETYQVQQKLKISYLSVFEGAQRVLTNVSLWTPDVLDHSAYEFAPDFWSFVLWARAQLVRMAHMFRFDLCSHRFGDSLIEAIAWVRALPSLAIVPLVRDYGVVAYLRIDVHKERAQEMLAMLKATAKCTEKAGEFEAVPPDDIMKAFYFSVSESRVSWNIIPSREVTPTDEIVGEEIEPVSRNLRELRKRQGGFSMWDVRFAGTKPRVARCGSLFGRRFAYSDLIGTLDERLTIAGVVFEGIGFRFRDLKMERVYGATEYENDVRLIETDMLALIRMDDAMQRTVVQALWPKHAYAGARRLLQVTGHDPDGDMNGIILSTDASEMANNRETFVNRLLINWDELIVPRGKLADREYLVSYCNQRHGLVICSFRINDNVMDKWLDHDLASVRTDGDAMLTMVKIRLMMGSDEFERFGPTGLSFYLGGPCRGNLQFPWILRLDGSEFVVCTNCQGVVCTFNFRLCSIRTVWASRKMTGEWLAIHDCTSSMVSCPLTGIIA